MEPPKYSDTISEDFILMECKNWPTAYKNHYQELNQVWNFFQTKEMTKQEVTVSEFVQPPKPGKIPKFGRNEVCPCGSQRKYKKCCGK